MKYLFYILAIISLALLLYSALHLKQNVASLTTIRLNEIKGFEDVNPNNNYTRLVDKFRQKIESYEDQANQDQSRYFWISFLVTALTAGSTLVSSIQVAKKEPDTNPKRFQVFAIIIALLTFSSTLANFASTHFNDLKTEEAKKAVELQLCVTNFRQIITRPQQKINHQ